MWDGNRYGTSWLNTRLAPGANIDLSIVAGDASTSHVVQMLPSTIAGLAGSLSNHPANTPLTLTWNASPSQYPFLPRLAYFRERDAYHDGEYFPLISDGACTLPASLFIAGMSFQIVYGTANDVIPAADGVDRACNRPGRPAPAHLYRL